MESNGKETPCEYAIIKLIIKIQNQEQSFPDQKHKFINKKTGVEIYTLHLSEIKYKIINGTGSIKFISKTHPPKYYKVILDGKMTRNKLVRIPPFPGDRISVNTGGIKDAVGNIIDPKTCDIFNINKKNVLTLSIIDLINNDKKECNERDAGVILNVNGEYKGVFDINKKRKELPISEIKIRKISNIIILIIHSLGVKVDRKVLQYFYEKYKDSQDSLLITIEKIKSDGAIYEKINKL